MGRGLSKVENSGSASTGTADGAACGGVLGICNLGYCAGRGVRSDGIGSWIGDGYGRGAPLVLAERELVSIATSFLVQYYEMVLALILER